MATNTITNVSGANQLSAEDKVFYERTLLERLKPELHFYKDAMKKKLPKNNGRTTNFRKFNSLEVPSASLTEGVTPAGSNLDVSTINAVIAQEGDFVVVSDLIQMTGIDPIVTETSELCGEQASQTLDSRIQDKLATGTNVYFAGGVDTRAGLETAETKVLTDVDVKKIARKLKKANAKRFADGYYHAIISPDVSYDLMNSTSWVDVAKYAKPENMLKGEIGKMHGVRFMESSNIQVVDSSDAGSKIDVHQNYFYGKDSYACIDVEGGAGKPSIIVKPNGSAGTADPLDQRASIGWKSAFTAVITEPLAIVRVECGVTQ